MQYFYELIENEEGLPIKTLIHSVDGIEMHWHDEMEIILVLQGSVKIRVEDEVYLLKEDELIIINSNAIHNTMKTQEDNILLAMQINQNYFSNCFPQFEKISIDCKSFLEDRDDGQDFDVIRHHLARIVWEINKKNKGYQLVVGSQVNLLAAYLINNFDYHYIEEEGATHINRDKERLQDIMDYINENVTRGVTLKEIAERVNLNPYYLSHFIKEKLGISFQEYLNYLRLDRATLYLRTTDKTITEIAYDSGYPSPKALNKQFRDAYGCSPTVYRNKNKSRGKGFQGGDESQDAIIERSRTYLDVDRNAALKKLFSYLEPDGDTKAPGYRDGEWTGQPSAEEVLIANALDKGIAYKPYWTKLTTFGRASEGLRRQWQKQLAELQRDIGFEYIRFHGIFSDDMMVYNIDRDGNIIYNWTYVDELFDFFMDVNIKPFVELGFMPTEIRKSQETMFWWRANISQPREIELWTDLVIEFLKHCINRYGIEEVTTWYFEIWNEPDLEGVFWVGGMEEYFRFYKETALAIKSLSQNLKVGGPSITHQTVKDNNWLEDFLIFCRDEDVPVDFVSLHIYSETFSSKANVEELMQKAEEGIDQETLIRLWMNAQRIYHGRDNTKETLESARDVMEGILPYRPELHITEWNASAYGRNPINDTSFIATFIIHNALQNIGMADSLGYWTFTDIMEEVKAGISPFHGGFGLINNHGIKKASYFAYSFLGKLGGEIVKQGDGYIVTKEKDNVQLLAYNHTYFDDLFMRGDTSALSNTDRYSVYAPKPEKEMEVTIDGLSGDYKITKYSLNRENGSAFDEWVKMGAPENMERNEVEYLKKRAHPKMEVELKKLDGKYREKVYVPVHGMELITLEKKYN